MNPYPLNAVFGLLQKAGVEAFRVELTDHAGHLGAIFFLRKARPAQGHVGRRAVKSIPRPDGSGPHAEDHLHLLGGRFVIVVATVP
jgi:hypothetical protein